MFPHIKDPEIAHRIIICVLPLILKNCESELFYQLKQEIELDL